jgi:hypothetical protein
MVSGFFSVFLDSWTVVVYASPSGTATSAPVLPWMRADVHSLLDSHVLKAITKCAQLPGPVVSRIPACSENSSTIV